MTPNNSTFIIRSVRERTEPLCKHLILEQGVNEEDVFIVREVPFSASMITSFKIGIEQDKKWTFCIDADVLLRPRLIQKMIQFAESQKEHVCEVQGFVLDKFFGGPRQAGNHLYRTLLLPEVVNRVPEEGTDIRPERFTLAEMKKDGYPWVKYPESIERRIKTWTIPELYYKHHIKSQGLDNKVQSVKRRMISSIKRRGIYRTGIMVMGGSLIRLGKLLKRSIA